MMFALSFVAKAHRQNSVSYYLMKEAIDYFNENRIYKTIELQGIYVVFENEYLNLMDVYITRAGLIFIGYNKDQKQIRVAYFDNAKFAKK